MGIQEALNDVLRTLPEERLKEVLDFAEFIRLKKGHEHWQKAGLANFGQCYGPNEPC